MNARSGIPNYKVPEVPLLKKQREFQIRASDPHGLSDLPAARITLVRGGRNMYMKEK